jgi:hypothetical protein
VKYGPEPVTLSLAYPVTIPAGIYNIEQNLFECNICTKIFPMSE